MENIYKTHKSHIIFALIFIAIGIVFSIQTLNKPLSDWGNYYYGSKFLTEGKFSPDVYECYKFNQMVRSEGETDIYLNYTPIPPFTALFYVPFQFAGSQPAKLIFNLLSVLLFTFSVLRLLKHLRVNSYFILVLPFILLMPMRNGIYFGQTYLLIISFLIEGYLAHTKGKNALAAVFFSIAILLKIFPGIILFYLLFKKEFRLIAYILITLILLFIITASITGWDLNYNYFSYILPRLFNNEINDTFASSYQSAQILFHKMFVYDKLLNPTPVSDNYLLFKIVTGIFSASILVICAAFSISKDRTDLSKFALWLLGGLLITGYGSNYSLILMIFILIDIFKEKDSSFFVMIISLGLAFAITSLPISMFSKFDVLLQFPRLYLIILFFLFVVIVYKTKFNYKFLSAIPVLAFIMVLPGLKNPDDGSSYVLDKEEALLINDYSESNGKLKIVFTDQNGRNEKELMMNISLNSSPDLLIAERKLFYKGKPSTTGKDNVFKPMIMNNNEIIYLSDKNRGVGFYTLRKIKLPE